MAAGLESVREGDVPVAQFPFVRLAAQVLQRARRKKGFDPGVVPAEAVETPVYAFARDGMDRIVAQQYLCVSVYDNPLNNVNFGTRVTLEQGATEAAGTVKDIQRVENGDFSSYVYVILPDEDSELFDFGDVSVVFDVYTRPDTVVVPQKAVRELGGRKFVNLLVDGVKIEQDVETGIEDGKNIEILSGLSGGEELILN